jgi:deoxyribonuclease V
VPLTDRGEPIGWVLRTRANVRPVYVSPGHRVSLAAAVDLVLACTTRYRLPETTRYAHRLASHGTLPL